ncbi:hypothetical protein UFOVP903_51 [uncultured Caudovirales phage]|uniref:Uncharacterized protein n=1 Tax=uncultured Caudovirales phage TaxID=2100421 RepID=A0A6J5SAL6_9CAUD|nr:hypothetical protein UFOVP903_51 [uncultured Caudovirales phage]CAB4198083.1 hypothetical protein UFOVP1318_53 [uncultured Caudovirales phage]CAB4210836.1 hypothetical protein UFOVP1430_49 [uncultured Caudovirales phage]
MSVGENVLVGNLSYLAIGREVTYGTYVTATAGIAFMSASMKTTKETKILEEIQTSRTNSHSIQLGKTVEGEIEAVMSGRALGLQYLLQNAFGGGPVTSATATGDTTGSVSFTHQVDIANFNTTYSSLSMNVRKGPATTGKIFEYCGVRVNEMGLKAEIDEPLMATFSVIAKDSTLSANDVSSLLDTLTASQVPLSFVDGRFSVETAPDSLTTTSFWHVQSFEFKISNNLNSDSASRRIGSDVIGVLPAGLAQFSLSAAIRFDTTTAFDAMIAGTRLAAEFEFLGATLPGSSLRERLKITMPYVVISDAGDPEISSAQDPLTSQVTFAVLRDPTTSGYAVRATVLNNTASYA